MKKLFIVLCLVVFVSHFINAQKPDVRERIYIQTNDNFFISGETLGFSVFVVSDLTQKPANKSNFIYVDLLNENGSSFQQKLKLENGRASSSFFISSLIKTGHYKLIAYTRWMKNFNEYFQLPIEIINPFEEFEQADTINNLLLQILPEFKNLVANVENTVCLRLLDKSLEKQNYTGKLIIEDAQEVESFDFDNLGFACIKIYPKSEPKYKILVTNEDGDISFFPLDFNVENGTKLLIKENDNEVMITVRSTHQNDFLYDLEIQHENGLPKKEMMRNSQTIKIAKTAFASGLLKFTLKYRGQTVDENYIHIASNNFSSPILTKTTYKKGDSALIYLPIPKGSYSVSIKMIHDDFSNNMLSAENSGLWFELDTLNFTTTILNNKKQLPKLNPFKPNDDLSQEINFLPESRNELISGEALRANGGAYANKAINLSLPGAMFQNQVVNTDDKGRFTFHFKPDIFDRIAYISPLNFKDSVTFNYESKFVEISTNTMHFPQINLDSMNIVNIKERSIRNQILNAYSLTDQTDSGTSVKSIWAPQINNYRLAYNFDDYKRFDDLKTHIIEYINLVSLRNGKIFLGELSVNIDSTNQLILLDGMPVDAREILKLNPYFVENVQIKNEPVYLGNGVFSGVLLINTKENSLGGYNTDKYSRLLVKGLINKATPDRAWYIPKKVSNEPDFREQLYWNPQLIHKTDGSAKIKFKTSDVSGNYLLKIDGFSENGIAISKSSILSVK